MRHSDSLVNIAPALAAAAATLRPVAKDSINPHFKNRYASLGAIDAHLRPLLGKHGLAVVQGATLPETTEGVLVGFAVETTIIHTSGEFISTSVFIPVDKPSPQGAVSAITYGRRAGLAAAFGLTTDDDDDGETAENHAPKPAAPRASTPPTPSKAPVGDEPPCPKCGGRVWDNRIGKKNPKAPDYKCRDKTCDGVVWPEREERQGELQEGTPF